MKFENMKAINAVVTFRIDIPNNWENFVAAMRDILYNIFSVVGLMNMVQFIYQQQT